MKIIGCNKVISFGTLQTIYRTNEGKSIKIENNYFEKKLEVKGSEVREVFVCCKTNDGTRKGEKKKVPKGEN